MRVCEYVHFCTHSCLCSWMSAVQLSRPASCLSACLSVPVCLPGGLTARTAQALAAPTGSGEGGVGAWGWQGSSQRSLRPAVHVALYCAIHRCQVCLRIPCRMSGVVHIDPQVAEGSMSMQRAVSYIRLSCPGGACDEVHAPPAPLCRSGTPSWMRPTRCLTWASRRTWRRY